MNYKAITRFVLFALLSALVVASAYALGYTAHAAYAPASDQVAEFAVFWEAWRIVQDHFYGDPPDRTDRTYGAIRGSLETLDDPYTYFVEPQERDREQEDLRGSFGGIGAFVERAADGRILLTPIEGQPADLAGIQTGDELVAVDGVPVTPDLPFDDVLAMVRGQEGKIVRLTVRREGIAEELTIAVTRAEIVTPSVTYELKTPTIGYIAISIFGERTSEELRDAILDLREQGAVQYVIDLRNNGGGLLPAAVDVATQFLKEGVVLYERSSDGDEKSYPVGRGGLLHDEPIVVLVNSGTASASEIVAGAIQDYGRGELIGTKTFGKASVQLIFDLSDGSSVHVTNARWLTPNRQEIDGVGLTPDVVVEITDQDRQEQRDPQLDRAIERLQESDTL
ncbi:MAG: S41 family peptidase [Anaerolineae bacterium]|nr:S41 family peptidase [Anaerolineae bacterium]